jgi:alpha-L-rhamnosidase
MISSGWRNENDSVEIDIQIPPNTTADVFMPTGKKENIFESCKPVEKINEIQSTKSVDGEIILHIGSGKYYFVVKN